MNALIKDVKQNIFSPKFIIGALLIFLLCLMSDAPAVSARVPLSVFDEITKMRYDVWLDKGIQFSSLSVFFGFDNSVWYSIVFPVIAAFPVIYNFSDEWFGDNYIMSLSRCGYKKYTIGKFVSAFITGMMTAVCGLLLFGLTVFAVFPSSSEFGGAQQLFLSGVYSEPLNAVIAKALNSALVCGACAVLSLFLCLVIRDKFFTLGILMAAFYFSDKLNTKFINSDLFINNEDIRWLCILFPSRQKDIYDLFPDYLGISFYYYVIAVALIAAVLGIVSYHLIKRRYRYGS